MKTQVIIVFLFFLIQFTCSSQQLETLGAGVLDFLLKNPKTANRMDPTESAALEIISGLLKTSADRQHELNVAETGRSQINLTTNDGRNAQIVRDASGQLYINYNGMIYPIATELVKEAKEISTRVKNLSSDVPEYDLKDLGEKYYSGNINKYNIRALWTYKWHKDFDGSGSLDIDEFRQIKRKFNTNEDFNIAIYYETIDHHDEVLLTMDIFNDYSGESMLHKEIILSFDRVTNRIQFLPIRPINWPSGIYLLVAKIQSKTNNEVLTTYKERVQIVEEIINDENDSQKKKIEATVLVNEPIENNNDSNKIMNIFHAQNETEIRMPTTASYNAARIPFTGDSGEFADSRDNKTYKWVKIGTQIWMAENLNIGTMINGGDKQENNGILEKYCYRNDESNCDLYGGLYQWDEIMDYSTVENSIGICPDGFHVPSASDWIKLITYLGGIKNASLQLKDMDKWPNKKKSTRKNSGFNALPVGIRNLLGTFTGVFSKAGFHGGTLFISSTLSSNERSPYIMAIFIKDKISYFQPVFSSSQNLGVSVRCLKN
jgi:uncharacterized protein (TIGR02145 family)